MSTDGRTGKRLKHEPAFIWAIITGKFRPQCDADKCRNRARVLIFHCETRNGRPLCLIHAARGRIFNRCVVRLTTALKRAA